MSLLVYFKYYKMIWSKKQIECRLNGQNNIRTISKMIMLLISSSFSNPRLDGLKQWSKPSYQISYSTWIRRKILIDEYRPLVRKSILCRPHLAKVFGVILFLFLKQQWPSTFMPFIKHKLSKERNNKSFAFRAYSTSCFLLKRNIIFSI